MSRRVVTAFLLSAFVSGCRSAGPVDGLSPEGKLARVGLEIISEDEAGVPPRERGKAVPCKVIDWRRHGGPPPPEPLPPHPSGYLIVGVDGEEVERAEEVFAALERWRESETLSLKVRRNPYLLPDGQWWEVDLQIVLR